MPDARLINRRLPSAEIGTGSARGRTLMTLFTEPNKLHIWWGCPPLVAALAAVSCRRERTTGPAPTKGSPSVEPF